MLPEDSFFSENFLDKKIQYRDHCVCYYYKDNIELSLISEIMNLNEIIILFIVARNHIPLKKEHATIMYRFVNDEYPFPPINHGYIYKIYNDVTTEVYIGQTTSTLIMRMNQHKKEWKEHSGRKLYTAFSLLGIDKFHIELIETISIPKLNERELYWINYYNSCDFGFNMTKKPFDRQYIG